MPQDSTWDIIVVGSGIAGLCAAAAASQEIGPRARILIASEGPIFSGSSFFSGTWGLGVVGPQDENDQQDLAHTIMNVGCSQADPALVHRFVAGIPAALQQIEQWGVTLRKPQAAAQSQKQYIPCFDHKHRSWRGLERASFASALDARLSQGNVARQGHWQLLDLTQGEDPSVNQALPEHTGPFALTFFDKQQQRFIRATATAVALCGGGTAGLFSRNLTSIHNSATMHALAQQAGCRLTNMAFIQFMPGLISPISNVVFNEKAWRYMQLPDVIVEALGGPALTHELLEQRSGYGPFTCQQESRAIDFALHQAGPSGLMVTPCFPSELPEFVQTYQDWLKSVLPNDTAPLRLAHYAHASNGGIFIGEDAQTDVPGLFAAGECTGGMHGADRLGGLSSANALVFGLQAGVSAARFAQNYQLTAPQQDAQALPNWTSLSSPCAASIKTRLTSIMDQACGVIRTQPGLEKAMTGLDALAHNLQQAETSHNPAQAAATRSLQLQLQTAQAVLNQAAHLPKSVGSHYVLPR